MNTAMDLDAVRFKDLARIHAHKCKKTGSQEFCFNMIRLFDKLFVWFTCFESRVSDAQILSPRPIISTEGLSLLLLSDRSFL